MLGAKKYKVRENIERKTQALIAEDLLCGGLVITAAAKGYYKLAITGALTMLVFNAAYFYVRSMENRYTVTPKFDPFYEPIEGGK